MTGPLSSSSAYDAASLAANRTAEQELVRRKQEMDGLKDRLSGAKTKDEKLREACQGFESVFINKLWTDMRKSVPKEGYLHSREEEQWLSMFDQELSSKLSKEGGIGLGDMLYSQLKDRLQAASRTLPSQVTERAPMQPLRRPGLSINGLPDGEGDEAAPVARTASTAAAPPAPQAVQTADASGQSPDSPGSLDPMARVQALAARIELEAAKANGSRQLLEAGVE